MATQAGNLAAGATNGRREPSAAGNQPEPINRRIGEALKSAVNARVPKADFDQRDPDYIRDTLPLAWILASLWHRADVRGLGNIPEEGPVLLVGNHSGGNISPDTVVFTLAFTSYFGVERPFYQLAHNLVTAMPWPGRFLKKFGTVAASHDNAAQALDNGAAVLVYPGGDWEVSRPSWKQATVDFGGRKGFLRLALNAGVPLVPVVSIGGQETALFLSRGEAMAKALGLDRLFRLKTLPVNIGIPWGLTIGDFVPRFPLPAKLTQQVLPPIDLHERFGEEPDLDEAYDYVVATMQEALQALAAERHLPLVG